MHHSRGLIEMSEALRLYDSIVLMPRVAFFIKVHESRQGGRYFVYCLDQPEPCQKELLEDV
jgi:hypothetical protein